MSSGGLASTYRRYARSRRKRRAWSLENPGNRAVREELWQLMIDRAGPELLAERRILDIGCGGGYWLRQLADHGVDQRRLCGIDALPARVASAASTIPEAEIVTADARRLPYPDGEFGLALLFTVLSSLQDRGEVAAVVREALRVIEPGGRLLIYEPRLPNPFNRSTRLIRRGAIEKTAAEWGGPTSVESLTLVPVLARRLGRATGSAYAGLAAIRVLRSHRLFSITLPDR